jgi:hypothetical protein
VDGTAQLCEHTFVPADEDDRRVLGTLFEHHPAMIDISTVLDMEGVEHPQESVDRLVGDGLIVRLGDRVGATLAARRARTLLS